MNRGKLLIALSAILAMTAGAARAHDSRPQRDPSCVGDCRSQHRTCAEAARADARMCAAETCSEQQDAVKAACEADPKTEACSTARQALRSCLEPCFEAYKTDLRECRATGQTCAEACPTRTPPPRPADKDRLCVGECRVSLGRCLADAREASLTCLSGCQDLVAAARQACAAGRSEACAAAREAAQQCANPCNQALREASTTCLKGSSDCVAQCPDRTPVVRPTPPRPNRGQ